MKTQSICLSRSDIFHWAQCPPGSAMLLQVTKFHFFFLIAEWYSIICIYHIFSIQLSVDAHFKNQREWKCQQITEHYSSNKLKVFFVWLWTENNPVVRGRAHEQEAHVCISTSLLLIVRPQFLFLENGDSCAYFIGMWWRLHIVLWNNAGHIVIFL